MIRITFLSLIAGLIISCNAGQPKAYLSTTNPTRVDSVPGSCPYLTKDQNNKVVLSWIKYIDSSTNAFCYAVDDGKGFGNAIQVPGSTNVHPHGENLPKIIFKPSGEIIAAWGAPNPNPNNNFSGLIYYSQSFNDGKSWTVPRLVTADTASFDQRYFDMTLLPDGEAAIVWLDNRKLWKQEGSALYYASTKGTAGFQDGKMIGGPACQCCRTDILVDRNKNIHVVYRAILGGSIRDMVHIISTDNAASFSTLELISSDNWKINGCPHTGPAITENERGLHFTWFTGGTSAGIYYSNSSDLGKSFTPRINVSGQSAKHCQIASLDHRDILIVWNESFIEGDNHSNRIGFERRDENGNLLLKQYVTPLASNSTFPVIATTNDEELLLRTRKILIKKITFFFNAPY
jgi:hypothetical protein